MWTLRLRIYLNFFPHSAQPNSNISERFFINVECLLRLLKKIFWAIMLLTKIFLPEWEIIWSISTFLYLKSFPHSVHLNSRFSKRFLNVFVSIRIIIYEKWVVSPFFYVLSAFFCFRILNGRFFSLLILSSAVPIFSGTSSSTKWSSDTSASCCTHSRRVFCRKLFRGIISRDQKHYSGANTRNIL